MFYFRSSLFKGGAKNDAKLKTNFETCKFFRRFFKLFFRRPAQKKHPGAQLPSLCPQPRLHLPAPSRPLRRDLRPKSECKVTPFFWNYQTFYQEISQKLCFLAHFSTFQPSQTLYNRPNADQITSQYGFPHTKQINNRPSKNHESLFPFPQYCEKNTGWQEVNTS